MKDKVIKDRQKTALELTMERLEREYQIDRQRINEDCERAVEWIRLGKS